MKKTLAFALVTILVLALATTALAAGHTKANIRVVHASPDAPAVDILVNDSIKAFENAPFTGITDYAELDADTYNIKVVPSGAMEPVVIEADLPLMEDKDYTVVAVGLLADIEPLVLEDNNAMPAAGKAHVRFVHASPDAPAVDIAVTGGPVLFSNIPFKGIGDYLPVDAATYDLEVRLAGTETVALSVPGVMLDEGNVYTIFAMGLAGGEPALQAVPSLDASYPAMLPETGAAGPNIYLILLGLGLALVLGGASIRLFNAQKA